MGRTAGSAHKDRVVQVMTHQRTGHQTDGEKELASASDWPILDVGSFPHTPISPVGTQAGPRGACQAV